MSVSSKLGMAATSRPGSKPSSAQNLQSLIQRRVSSNGSNAADKGANKWRGCLALICLALLLLLLVKARSSVSLVKDFYSGPSLSGSSSAEIRVHSLLADQKELLHNWNYTTIIAAPRLKYPVLWAAPFFSKSGG